MIIIIDIIKNCSHVNYLVNQVQNIDLIVKHVKQQAYFTYFTITNIQYCLNS